MKTIVGGGTFDAPDASPSGRAQGIKEVPTPPVIPLIFHIFHEVFL